MSDGSGPLARILLKARPTPLQLADRLCAPWPDGLELYLDRADIATEADCRTIIERVRAWSLPSGFAFVVEGPIRSLDNEYVDISASTPATRELITRLGHMAVELGADAVVTHCITPRFSIGEDDWQNRDQLRAQCCELLRFYADTLGSMGLVPVIENVPPVLRMREGRYLYTPLGMAPEDIVWFLHHVPGLMVTLDISHAQLYVNARRMAAAGETSPDVEPLMRYLRHLPAIESLDTFLDAFGTAIFEAHVSNASGLLGEGAPYHEGDIDMDHVIARLATTARYLVTETLEPDHDRAVYMREAQQGMAAVLARLGSGS